MTPHEFLLASRRLMGSDGESLALWSRASAVLARRAIELKTAEILAKHKPGCQSTRFTVQLLCLIETLKDRNLAQRVASTWAALSCSLHHNACEMAPVATELLDWIGVVGEFLGEHDQTP